MKTHKFNGVTHDVLIEKLDGFCFKSGWQSSRPTLVIPIEQDDSFKFLETAIHESLHCSFPYMSEEKVTESAHDIARFVWRLDYRRTR